MTESSHLRPQGRQFGLQRGQPIALSLFLQQLPLSSIGLQHLRDEFQPVAQGILLVVIQLSQQREPQNGAQGAHQFGGKSEKPLHVPPPCHFSANDV